MDAEKVVLIVDDDRAVLETMRMLLEARGGFRVHCALGATGASGHLNSHGPVDVLIADVILAGEITGIDICHMALRQCPSVGLVVISADPQIDPRDVPERSVYLRKPFGGHELIDAIGSAMARRPQAKQP
jgi:DNA-binding NtrC family response regulator